MLGITLEEELNDGRIIKINETRYINNYIIDNN